jgi:hypothetical protein
MKIYITIICLIAFTITGCHFGTSGTWENDRIDPTVKSTIDDLNKKLFIGVRTKDITGLKQLMSPMLVEKAGKTIDTLINSVGDNYNLEEFETVDDFYIKNSTANINDHLLSIKHKNNYTIDFTALNKEMFVSLLSTKNLPLNCAILAIYGKYDNGWKLNILRFGNYSMFNKTAPDYYNDARKQYEEGNLVDAVDMISMATQLAKPLDAFLKYNANDEIQDFNTKVVKDAMTKFPLPLTISGVKTKPQIFFISPQFVGNGAITGIFPLISYKSQIKLTDTLALRIENTAIQQEIVKIFKGIDKNKKAIIYQAYNQIPDGKTTVNRYGFIQKL